MNRKPQNLDDKQMKQIIPNPEQYDIIVIGGQEAKLG
jgi:hypothetical protein